MTGEHPGEPFGEHVGLFQAFLAHRAQLVEQLQTLLNAQHKPSQYLQAGAVLSRGVEDCFFSLEALTAEQRQLRGRLQQAHWTSGFRPRRLPGLHNDLVDPGQMMVRAFHLWRQTRWPGRNGRCRFAQTLFNLYLLRSLEHAVMRVWDAGSNRAATRLLQIQSVLDALWAGAPPDQPVFVRDARWLFALAQSPTTDELAGYFEVLERIAASFGEEDRLEIHKASVQMAGGHLRSQLRHYLMNKHVSLDEQELILTSRNSNALDFATLIQGLVPLLTAYERASHDGDQGRRLDLASAICQGISADPELFVNRVDLLAAYTMIEHLFVATDAQGQAVHTPMGRRHAQLLRDYAARIGRMSEPLLEDCPRFRPVAGRYSPYGLIYGFSSNLTEHMALKVLQVKSATHFSLEDVFTDGDERRLAWVNGWRKLPHISPDVQQLFDYPLKFAADIFDRIEQALRTRIAGPETAARTGRLFIAGTDAAQIPALPVRFIGSSDPRLLAAGEAQAYDEAQLLRDRREGMFAVSYETAGGWVALSKDILTQVLAAGSDARIMGLPQEAAGALRLMCPDLVQT